MIAWWKDHDKVCYFKSKDVCIQKVDKKVEDKRCKGTKKCVVADGPTFDDYKICLFDGSTIYKEHMLFENKKTRGVHGK